MTLLQAISEMGTRSLYKTIQI